MISEKCRRAARDMFFILRAFGALSTAALERYPFAVETQIGTLRRLLRVLTREGMLKEEDVGPLEEKIETIGKMVAALNWPAVRVMADEVERAATDVLFNRLVECEMEARK